MRADTSHSGPPIKSTHVRRSSPSNKTSKTRSAHSHTVTTQAQVHSRPTTPSQDRTKPSDLLLGTTTPQLSRQPEVNQHTRKSSTPTLQNRTTDSSHDPSTDIASAQQSINAPLTASDIISNPTFQQQLQDIDQQIIRTDPSDWTSTAPTALNNPSTADLPLAVNLSATNQTTTSDIFPAPTSQQHLQDVDPQIIRSHPSRQTPTAPTAINNPSTADPPTTINLSATHAPTHPSHYDA